MQVISFLKTHKWLFLVLFTYLILRLINLTLLPIFNDESIYLDWGWREIHNPGYLYYSLYDAKQPLLMWFFGISQQLFQDPLLGGRLVSVIAGMFTLLGIYYFSNKYFTQKIAVISSLLYIFIPIFSFYDRLALMESAVSACGIWSGILFIEVIKKSSLKNLILLGLTLGIGFFIKSSVFIFILSFIFLSFVFLYKSKLKFQFTKAIFIVLLTFLSTILLLLINPQFWSTFSTNSRYTLTIYELLRFPFGTWISNILGNFEIALFYLTPLILVAFCLGVIKTIRERNKYALVFLAFFGLSLIISTLVTRASVDRYLVSFLTFTCIFAGYFTYSIFLKNKYAGFLVFSTLLLSSGIFTIVQITNPPLYLKTMSKLTIHNQLNYLEGVNAGYGIADTLSFIKSYAGNKPLFIGVAENTGNPESAMFIYFNKDKNINTAYFDLKLLGTDISSYSCLSLGVNFLFISRDNQQGGLEKFMEKIKTINNPYGNNSIGIYQLKKNCKGKYLQLAIKRNQ